MPTLALPFTSSLASIEPPLIGLLTLGQKEPAFLVSIYAPLVMLIAFIPWAWIISKVYDKHAAQFFLPRRTWNVVHMAAGVLALATMLFLPSAFPGALWGFWVALAAALVILVADLYTFVHIANKDDRVPERHHITWATFFKRDEKKKAKVTKGPAEIKYTIRAPDDKGKYTKAIPAPLVETPEMELRVAAEKLYSTALRARAAQIDFGPAGTPDGAYTVKHMIDGVFQNAEGGPLPAATAARLMDFFKSCAGLDVADRRRKLQGLCQIEEIGGAFIKHTVRVTSMGAQGGMRVSLLLDPEIVVNKKVEELGLLPMQIEELKAIVDDGKGVVLVAAPRDNGRTTLLYSVLRKHDAYINNVQTVEIDPQAALEGVRMNKFDSESATPLPPGAAGPEFATTVRTIMRRDPQIVGVSEMPDAATAKEVSRADHDRTRVYISFVAPDSLTAVQAWAKAVGEQRAAADCLHGVIAGKLLRKLCTNCRVAYQPAPDMLKKLGLPEKVQQLFKKGGQVLVKNKPEACPVCQGGGYFGQEGVYEVCLFDKEARDLIAAGNLNGLKAWMRTKRNAPTIQQVAIRKAVDGITSVEEVLRITTGEGGGQPAGAGGSPTGGGGGAPGSGPSGKPSGPTPGSPAPKAPPPKQPGTNGPTNKAPTAPAKA
jgi:type II secretory ATPase GspE/PulE/Tfp pilus assembly ATPase PilB-like protein